MKICFLTDVFLPRIDGVSNSVYHLSRQMSHQGHEVMVFAPKLEGSEQVKVEGVELKFIPSIPALVYPETRIGLLSPKLIKKINDFDPDIIHVTTPGTLGLMGLMFSRILKIPVVGVFHGYFMTPEYLEIVGIKRVTKPFEKMLWRIARDFYDKCDLVITPSKYVKNDLLDHKFSAQIEVIKNAAEIDISQTDDKLLAQFVDRHQIKKTKTVIYIGRLSVEKNLKKLVKVFAYVLKKEPSTQLVLIGDGPEKSCLQQQAEQMKINQQVIFTGAVDHEFLIKAGLYRIGDVFATCSTTEVQPMSFIEAMHFGVPIVAYQARGSSEMVEGNGFLVSPGQDAKMAEKIVQILNDPNLQKKLSAQSKEQAEKYDIAHIADEHISVYRKLIRK